MSDATSMKPIGSVTFRKKLIDKAIGRGVKKLRVPFLRAQFVKIVES